MTCSVLAVSARASLPLPGGSDPSTPSTDIIEGKRRGKVASNRGKQWMQWLLHCLRSTP